MIKEGIEYTPGQEYPTVCGEDLSCLVGRQLRVEVTGYHSHVIVDVLKIEGYTITEIGGCERRIDGTYFTLLPKPEHPNSSV